MTKLVNKVLIINGRRTSMRLCLSEWCALERICREEKLSRNRLIEIIENSNRVHLGLTYLTRLFTLFYFYNQAVSPKEHFGRKKGSIKRISAAINAGPQYRIEVLKVPAGAAERFLSR